MKRIWILERAKYQGRLGNRLGLFAHFVACCLNNNDSLINFGFAEYADEFKNINSGLISFFPRKDISVSWNGITYYSCQTAIKILKQFPFSTSIEAELRRGEVLTQERHFDLNSPELQNYIAKYRLIFCRGWRFRCFNLINDHAQNIRNFFAPSEVIETATKKWVNSIREEGKVIVGVHIRAGDYKRYWNGKYYYTPSKYAKIMKKIPKIFNNHKKVAFIIFSDEKQSVHSFPELDVQISQGSPVYDLSAMSFCDYLMGPPSTFSNWASFYGQVPMWYIPSAEAEPSLDKFRVYLPLEIDALG